MKFKYTALGASNQKLEGVLDADSLDIAREELHKMGLSVIAISEISAEEAITTEATTAAQTQKQGGVSTFYFLSKDPAGKEVNGTIDSKDANSAFRRLIIEYGFEVIDLYPEGAADPTSESLKSKFEEWKTAMEDEGIDLSRKQVSNTKNELDEGEKMNEEVVAEIDQFIINTKGLLKSHSDQYSDAFLREIQKTLGELEKVRASNNIKHITKVCNNLYELVSNPDKPQSAKNGEADAAYQEAIAKLRANGFVANPFQFLESHNIQQKLAQFEGVQSLMGRIKKILGKDKGQEQEKKKRKSSWLTKLTRSMRGRSRLDTPRLSVVIGKFFDYVAAPSPILRRAKKQEMIKSFRQWREGRKQAKLANEAKRQEGGTEGVTGAEGVVSSKPKRDFSGLYMELDSFVGWLLFFYIVYFFLVGFAIEKNIGLPQGLVLKTISSPIIINISIFLVIAHLAFTLKIHFFRSNFLGSLFLFFLSFGAYTILVINF